jgi:hypothetical protein
MPYTQDNPMPLMVTRVGMQDLDGTRWPMARIRYVLQSIPLPVAVDWLSRISLTLRRCEGPYDRRVQLELVEGLCKPGGRLKRKLLAYKEPNGNPNVSYFDTAQVCLAARAVLECCTDACIPDKAPNPDGFAQALIALSDSLGQDEGDGADGSWVLRNIMPDILFRSEVHSLNAHARWGFLLDELPGELKAPSGARWVNIDEEFRKATGVTKADYRAVAMGLLAMLTNQSEKWDVRRPGLLLRWQSWFSNHRLSPAEQKVLDEICATRDVLLSEFSSQSPIELAPYDFLAFRRHPLIRVGDLAACPNPDFLLDLASGGIYHRLFSHYRLSGDHVGRQRLSDFLGLVFQEYVFRLISNSQTGISDACIVRIDNGEACPTAKRCDLAITEGSQLTLLECKTGFFSQLAAAQADVKAYENDLRRVFGVAASQLSSTIRDLQSGVLSLPGLRWEDITAIAPVLVGMQEIPPDFFTGKTLDRLQHKDVPSLASPRMLRAQSIDIDTLEGLLPCVTRERGVTHFMSTLSEESDKRGHPVSARNWFYLNYPSPKSNGFLRQVSDRLQRETLSFWEERKVSPTAEA